MTISYISGYLIEKTLSVDNLFVMMMIFNSFGVDKKDYQHVLKWGILVAIVLRFVFIFAGAALISRFAWILLVFGGFQIGLQQFICRFVPESPDRFFLDLAYSFPGEMILGSDFFERQFQ